MSYRGELDFIDCMYSLFFSIYMRENNTHRAGFEDLQYQSVFMTGNPNYWYSAANLHCPNLILNCLYIMNKMFCFYKYIIESTVPQQFSNERRTASDLASEDRLSSTHLFQHHISSHITVYAPLSLKNTGYILFICQYGDIVYRRFF